MTDDKNVLIKTALDLLDKQVKEGVTAVKYTDANRVFIEAVRDNAK